MKISINDLIRDEVMALQAVMPINRLPIEILGIAYAHVDALRAFGDTLQKKALPSVALDVPKADFVTLYQAMEGKEPITEKHVYILRRMRASLEKGYAIVAKQRFTMLKNSLAKTSIVDSGASEPYILFAIMMLNSCYRGKECHVDKARKEIRIDEVKIAQNADSSVSVRNYPCACYPSAWGLFLCDFAPDPGDNRLSSDAMRM